MLVIFMAENKNRAPLPTDGNDRVLMGGVSSADGFTPIPMEVNPLSGGALVESVSGKTLKSAPISLTSSGIVVAAVTGKKICVYAVKLVASAACTVKFSRNGSIDIEGAQSLAANGGYTESVQPPDYLFETADDESLDLIITGSTNIGGRVSYFEI